MEFLDSSSDGSSDYEHDRNCRGYLREQRSYNHPTGEVLPRVERLSLRDQNIPLQDDFSSDEGESGKAQDYLLFEYLERDPPFGREPLANKVSALLHFVSSTSNSSIPQCFVCMGVNVYFSFLIIGT